MEGYVKVYQYLSYCLHTGSLCAGKYILIDKVVDKRKMVYSATRWISLGSEKVLRVRCDESQVERREDPSVNTQPRGVLERG